MLYITINVAITLNGYMNRSDSKSISSLIDWDQVYHLRSIHNAILVGMNTIRKDDTFGSSYYYPNNPTRVCISDSGNIPCNLRYLKESVIIFINKKNINNLCTCLFKRKNIYIETINHIDIINIIDILSSKYHMYSMLVEGGYITLNSFISNSLFNKISISISDYIDPNGKYSFNTLLNNCKKQLQIFSINKYINMIRIIYI